MNKRNLGTCTLAFAVALVWWGDQTWEEMRVSWFGVIVTKDLDPTKVMAYAPEAR